MFLHRYIKYFSYSKMFLIGSNKLYNVHFNLHKLSYNMNYQTNIFIIILYAIIVIRIFKPAK